MTNGSDQILIKKILKILKLKTKSQLSNINRKYYENWDSLAHLEILFLLEKNSKKKVKIKSINKISKGIQILKHINEN